MAAGEKEREDKQLERLRKLIPAIAGGMSLVTFVVIEAAGHPTETSLLVAAIMFAFVYGTFMLRQRFGVKGFIFVLFALSALGLLIQRFGWL